MATANALIARLETATSDYRVAPQNIEAEQALLGAILVNNEAFYRVSDFLEPNISSSRCTGASTSRRPTDPRRQGRDPGDDQDLPAGRPRHRRLTCRSISARLAAEATTIINAEDYGRTVYDLAIRR